MNMSVDDAFGTFSPIQGDVVKSQSAFAMYDNKKGWLGSLTFMQPGAGYMYRSLTTSPTALEFKYPESGSLRKSGFLTTDAPSSWNFDVKAFADNMSVVATVKLDGTLSKQAFIAGAFAGDQCRGYASGIATSNDELLYFIPVAGNTVGNNIKFSIYDEKSGKTYQAVETITYKPNEVVGSIENPMVLTITTTATGFGDNLWLAEPSIWPNPFNTTLKIDFSLANTEQVGIEIFSITGVKIAEISAKDYSAGRHVIEWQNNALAAGIYTLRIKVGDWERNYKVVKY